MKTTKKIISLLLTIQILFACTLVPSAMATDSVMEEPIDAVEVPVTDEGESPEELSPMMAARCGYDYNFSDSAWEHMNGDRYVPVSVLDAVIKGGVSYPDPGGTAALMYYAVGYVNSAKYNFEVLYDAVSNTIWHYLYTQRALGPLPQLY